MAHQCHRKGNPPWAHRVDGCASKIAAEKPSTVLRDGWCVFRLGICILQKVDEGGVVKVPGSELRATESVGELCQES